MLQLPVYTFGGLGNEGSAPAPAVIPGNLDNALERAAVALARQEARLEELTRNVQSGLIIR